MNGTVSWRTLLDETSRLVDRGDARRIVEEASGYSGAELVTVLDAPASQRGVASLDRMVARRVDGEPLQYVLGRWGFRSLDLAVDGRVLIPRPETEVVAGLAVDLLHEMWSGGERLVAVDLGTGSGAIGLSLATECVHAEVICTDVSPEALAVARANLSGIGRPATRVRMLEGSWYEALPPDLAGRVDLIVSNPPYVADEEELPAVVELHEPARALRAGPTGLEAAEQILRGAPEWLRPGGALVLELAPHQMQAATQTARAVGFDRVSVHADLSGRDRALVLK